MSTTINSLYPGMVAPNTRNWQTALHPDVSSLLGRLYPQDQVSLSPTAKLMLMVQEQMAKAAGGGAAMPSTEERWAALQQIAAAAAQGTPLWQGGDVAPASSTADTPTSMTVSAHTFVTGYERAVVTGGSGGDDIQALNDVVISGGVGDDHLYARSSAVLSGGDGRDWLQAGKNAVISGGAGSDHVYVNSNAVVSLDEGDDMVLASGDNCVISGGSGRDRIDVRGANAIVSGGDDEDIIMTGQNAQVSGGTGQDEITTGAGSTVEGGEGNDVLYVAHDSTIVFGRGDGQDRVYGYLRSAHAGSGGNNYGAASGFVRDSTIAFREGVSASDLAVSEADGNLTIAINGTTDRMTIYGYSDQDNLKLSFADGTTAALASFPRQAPSA
ncbi:MAG: hypothetical protein IPK66_07355 [Rhodospirillales bacterium]|nr:hypothetical protein [Rhodospirillales bacterium]